MHGREREIDIIYIYTYILYTYCTIICIHLLHKSPNCCKYGPYWTIHEYTLYNLRCMDGMDDFVDIPRRFWAPWPARQCPSPCSFPTWGPWGLNTQKETTIEDLSL